jgi:hypothetical protein
MKNGNGRNKDFKDLSCICMYRQKEMLTYMTTNINVVKEKTVCGKRWNG